MLIPGRPKSQTPGGAGFATYQSMLRCAEARGLCAFPATRADKARLCAAGDSPLPLNVPVSPARKTGRGQMTTLYFHCADTREVLLDRSGSEVEDMYDVRARAFQIIQAIITLAGPQDWREWNVHVRDDEGEEHLVVPFASVLGKPH